MELGNLIWFSCREHPFAVRERHCLDLECSCTDVGLTLTEVDLEGKSLPEPLHFEIRVNLKNGREYRPPRRPPEIQALVREFLVRFPVTRFDEMIDRRRQQREGLRRLEEYTVDAAAKGELLSYSEVVHKEGGVAESGRHYSFFFFHEGRDYLIEDHYCFNPACDCRKVHIEFWERIELPGHPPKVDLWQRLLAAFTLDGRFVEIQFSEGDRQAAEQIARAWGRRFAAQFETFRRRYAQMKAIGRRSMPKEAPPLPAPVATSSAGPRRNDRCPCGSGRKYKHCCGRR